METEDEVMLSLKLGHILEKLEPTSFARPHNLPRVTVVASNYVCFF
jgi:hypothetical protein